MAINKFTHFNEQMPERMGPQGPSIRDMLELHQKKATADKNYKRGVPDSKSDAKTKKAYYDAARVGRAIAK